MQFNPLFLLQMLGMLGMLGTLPFFSNSKMYIVFSKEKVEGPKIPAHPMPKCFISFVFIVMKPNFIPCIFDLIDRFFAS